MPSKQAKLRVGRPDPRAGGWGFKTSKTKRQRWAKVSEHQLTSKQAKLRVGLMVLSMVIVLPSKQAKLRDIDPYKGNIPLASKQAKLRARGGRKNMGNRFKTSKTKRYFLTPSTTQLFKTSKTKRHYARQPHHRAPRTFKTSKTKRGVCRRRVRRPVSSKQAKLRADVG